MRMINPKSHYPNRLLRRSGCEGRAKQTSNSNVPIGYFGDCDLFGVWDFSDWNFR